MLNNVEQYHHIDKIDIYGGEILLLNQQYLTELIQLAKAHCKDVYVTTNLFDPTKLDFLRSLKVNISVSINKQRTNFAKLDQYLINNDVNDIGGLIVVTEIELNSNIDDLIDKWNQYNLQSITLLQYYDAIKSKVHYDITDKQYNDFVNKVIDRCKSKDVNFTLTNKNVVLDDCISNHVYIMPNSKYATTMYDLNNREYFQYFDKYEDLIKHNIALSLKQCVYCPHYKRCDKEHYRNNCDQTLRDNETITTINIENDE